MRNGVVGVRDAIVKEPLRFHVVDSINSGKCCQEDQQDRQHPTCAGKANRAPKASTTVRTIDRTKIVEAMPPGATPSCVGAVSVSLTEARQDGTRC